MLFVVLLYYMSSCKKLVSKLITNPPYTMKVFWVAAILFKIFTKAYAAGVRNYFLEQEPPFDKPRVESAEIGYKYLSTLIV